MLRNDNIDCSHDHCHRLLPMPAIYERRNRVLAHCLPAKAFMMLILGACGGRRGLPIVIDPHLTNCQRLLDLASLSSRSCKLCCCEKASKAADCSRAAAREGICKQERGQAHERTRKHLHGRPQRLQAAASQLLASSLWASRGTVGIAIYPAWAFLSLPTFLSYVSMLLCYGETEALVASQGGKFFSSHYRDVFIDHLSITE